MKFPFIHLAVVIILCGALVTTFFGKRGYIGLSRGGSSGYFETAAGARQELGFDVKLDGFNIRDFQSDVSFVEDGKTALNKRIEVNRPAGYKGYSFYQAGYDKDRPDWSNLEVVKDPGAGIVFFGFVLLNIGAVLTGISRNVYKIF
jgi:cytochrome c biogenesis protein ResB